MHILMIGVLQYILNKPLKFERSFDYDFMTVKYFYKKLTINNCINYQLFISTASIKSNARVVTTWKVATTPASPTHTLGEFMPLLLSTTPKTSSIKIYCYIRHQQVGRKTAGLSFPLVRRLFYASQCCPLHEIQSKRPESCCQLQLL